MIGYRNAETVLNENPSKTLAFEIIKMGRVWILYKHQSEKAHYFSGGMNSVLKN